MDVLIDSHPLQCYEQRIRIDDLRRPRSLQKDGIQEHKLKIWEVIAAIGKWYVGYIGWLEMYEGWVFRWPKGRCGWLEDRGSKKQVVL